MSELMHEYNDIVVASFYGHTHLNEFYVVRDTTTSERTPLHVNFVTPAFEGIILVLVCLLSMKKLKK